MNEIVVIRIIKLRDKIKSIFYYICKICKRRKQDSNQYHLQQFQRNKHCLCHSKNDIIKHRVNNVNMAERFSWTL